MRIAVLLSGGVDSSVALRLLAEEGHELTAFYLKIWLEDDLAHLGSCPWEEDLRYARAVCESLRIPLEVVPLQREYHQRIVAFALAELRAGHTPSPDVFCNQRIKFGAFVDHLAPAAFDRIASGHYARVEQTEKGPKLLRAADPVKDQTYFLSALCLEQLARCCFPLGPLPKAEVRSLARRFGLPTAERPDSQGICFLGKVPYDDFVRGYLGDRPGEIVELGSSRVLGEHRGLWYHTIGQRKGLGLSGGPWYVAGKDMATNRLLVVHGESLVGQQRDRFRLTEPSWLAPPPLDEELEVKIRHSPQTFAATLAPLPDGELEVRLQSGDPGIAPGQWAVVYRGERCLGGGTIALTPAPLPEGEGLKIS